MVKDLLIVVLFAFVLFVAFVEAEQAFGLTGVYLTRYREAEDAAFYIAIGLFGGLRIGRVRARRSKKSRRANFSYSL